MSLEQRPRPEPDRDSAPWWAAVRRHELLVQRCTGCGTRRFPARAVCNRCRSHAAEWVPSTGTGTVYSWIVNHQVFMPALADEVPLPILLVRLDDGDGILMYGNLSPAQGVEISQGMPVEAVFVDVADDLTLVQWRSTGERRTVVRGSEHAADGGGARQTGAEIRGTDPRA